MADDVTDLGARRSLKTDDPAKVLPRDVLLRVLERIDSGESAPDHIMVISGFTTEDGGGFCDIDHAGGFSRYAQYGLLADGVRLLQNA